jgi:hypothetical protein
MAPNGTEPRLWIDDLPVMGDIDCDDFQDFIYDFQTDDFSYCLRDDDADDNSDDFFFQL